MYWKKTLLLAASICFSIDVLAQSSTQEREEQQRVKEVQATEMEREVRDVEREMRVAETRLADAARQVAELSSRQIEIVGSTGWNFDLDFDVHDKPVLGITIGVANKNEPVEGVSIIGVSPGGAAAEAGLRSGDVITAVNTDSLSAENAVGANQKLVDVLEGVAQGDVLDVTYLRAGKTSIVEISPRRMTARVFEFRGPGSGLHVPVPSVAPTAPGARFEEFIFISGGGWGDLGMVPLTKDLGRYFGAEEGLLVVRAPTDENFKLRDGDVIEDIDGRKPESVSHAIRILASYQSGEELKLKIMRDKRRQTLKIEMPDNRSSRIDEFMVPHVESRVLITPVSVKPAAAPRPIPAEEST